MDSRLSGGEDEHNWSREFSNNVLSDEDHQVVYITVSTFLKVEPLDPYITCVIGGPSGKTSTVIISGSTYFTHSYGGL